MREVFIEWEAPCAPDKIDSTKKGLYQFYGYHHVYSKDCKDCDVLLYIGETKGHKGLKSRLQNHEYIYGNVPKLFKPKLIKVGIGHITYNPDDVCLEDIEGFLIFVHTPAWNSEMIRESQDIYHNLIIHNKGAIGSLMEEIDGRKILPQ